MDTLSSFQQSAYLMDKLLRLAAGRCFAHGEHHYLGRYSIEKLYLFTQYQRTTSRLRVAAVLLLTPVPTVLVLLAMDVIPLNDPSAGARANSVAFFRSTIAHATLTFMTMLPMKQALALSDKEYSYKTMALIGCCTAITMEAVCIPLALTWKFPLPFREMIGLPIWMTSVCVYNALFAWPAMRRAWRHRQQLQLYLPIVSVQLVMFYLFLALSVGFAFLSSTPQIVLVLTFPLVKFSIKRLLWNYAKQMHDISTDVTVCLMEISGSLYQTVCMQFVTSSALSVLIMVVDFVQAIWEVRVYIKTDYLSDGRHSLATALKIVGSSLAIAKQEAVAGPPGRHSPTLASLRSESAQSTRWPRPSATANDLVQSTLDETMGVRWLIQQNARSVYLPPKIIYERHTRKKTRRRLLDLDRVANTSEGRTSQSEASSTHQLVSPIPSQRTAATTERESLALTAPTSARVPFKSSAADSGATSSVPLNMLQLKSSLQASHKEMASSWTWVLELFALRSKSSKVVVHYAFPLHTNTSTTQQRATRYLAANDPSTIELPESSLATQPSSSQRLLRQGSLGTLRSGRLERTYSNPVLIDGIHISRRDQARVLEQTLQLLFASEVLLFVEYMEVVVPVLYALCIGTEWVLPNGKYNIVVMKLTADGVVSQISTSLLYALLELMSMVAMSWFMGTKYGISSMYQLAFVLERYWMTLQGKLVGSFIVVWLAVTVHQGTDFSFLSGKS